MLNTIKKLQEKTFHKLIIGAALKDYQAIEDFSYYFSHAGADVIDISAFPHSVICAKQGIKKAVKEDTSLTEPLIMVSVNIGEDPHFRRIEINWDNCTECLACVSTCPSEAFAITSDKPLVIASDKPLVIASDSEAISSIDSARRLPRRGYTTPRNDSLNYNADLCFGCSNCLPSCNFDAFSFENWSAFETQSLIELQKLGASAIELHLNNDLDAFKTFYKKMPEFELESFCIGSEKMTELDLQNATNAIIEAVSIKRGSQAGYFIIQTDGIPLSGARDMGNTEKDLISIQNAKIVKEHIRKQYPELEKDIFIQLAGGITEHSLNKAIKEGLEINGVAIGSYARKLIQDSANPSLTAKRLIQDSKRSAS